MSLGSRTMVLGLRVVELWVDDHALALALDQLGAKHVPKLVSA